MNPWRQWHKRRVCHLPDGKCRSHTGMDISHNEGIVHHTRAAYKIEACRKTTHMAP
jgi:hypothetical protein